MIRAVLDTNVIISALIYPEGLQSRVLNLGLHGRVKLYISPPMMSEYERVLNEPRLKFPKDVIRGFLGKIKKTAMVVEPMQTLFGCTDEDDNRILECANTAGADFLVTGNKRHFPTSWKQTQIVNGREFLELAFPRIAQDLRPL